MSSKRERILRDLAESMISMELDAVKSGVAEALEAGIPAQRIITEALGVEMEHVGNKFAEGEYFLSELIFAGYIMQEALAVLEPHLEAGVTVSEGRVVIASVEGDLHDIGKNIAMSMLRSAGFEVIDLGVDVPAERIVEKAEEHDADIVALSALLSVVVPYMERTVRAVKESSIGGRVKVLLGGRAADIESARRMGADAYAHDAWEGISKAKELMASIAPKK